MKISVIYDSKTGNTETVAQYMVKGMESVSGVQARTFRYDRIDEDFVKASDGLVFGCPTYMGGPTADFYGFLEKKAGELALAHKLGGAFATEQYIHGGADLTIMRIVEHLMVMGMMVYSGGAGCGDPVIHYGPVEVSAMGAEKFRDLFETYGRRFAEQAVSIGKQL
ncbi:MAG: flavodoxin family protein [Anaerovoracaceae bacterium]|jgi:NAD(P)H dehydrogenase (quinone)